MALCFTIKASKIKPQEAIKNKGRVLTKITSPSFSITVFFRSVSSSYFAYLFSEFSYQLFIIYFVPDEDRCQDIIAIFVWYLFCIDELFSFVEYVFLILFYWFFSPADNFFHKHQKGIAQTARSCQLSSACQLQDSDQISPVQSVITLDIFVVHATCKMQTKAVLYNQWLHWTFFKLVWHL